MSGEAGASSNSVVELRVHGVSGTPPEEILKCPTELLERVAGNNAAGFFRCRPCCDGQSEKTVAAELNGQPLPITQEAYSWGGLTSGPATRARGCCSCRSCLSISRIGCCRRRKPGAARQRFPW